MPFIGNQPADKFLTLEKQVFTTSATATYTLDREVSSVNDLELFLNNVRQEPTTAYTISGTTLTLASAITSSDSMYCIYQGRAVGTQSPATGSVTNAMLQNSSITLNGSAVSLGGSATVGGNNTPSFSASMSGNQSIGDDTQTKVQFDTEEYDTDGCYDTSNYRFTPTTAGKYFISAFGYISTEAASNYDSGSLYIYKNGSLLLESSYNMGNNFPEALTGNISAVIDMNGSTDYLEIYARVNTTGGSNIIRGTRYSRFFGYKLIGV